MQKNAQSLAISMSNNITFIMSSKIC